MKTIVYKMYTIFSFLIIGFCVIIVSTTTLQNFQVLLYPKFGYSTVIKSEFCAR